MAAKIGGGILRQMHDLENAILAARAENMPNDRIKKSIDAGTGAEITKTMKKCVMKAMR